MSINARLLLIILGYQNKLPSSDRIFTTEMAGNEKRHLEGLFLVESRIAEGRIVEVEIRLLHTHRSSYALGDRIPGEFEVDPAEEGAVLLVYLQSRRDFGKDAREMARLDPARRGASVSVTPKLAKSQSEKKGNSFTRAWGRIARRQCDRCSAQPECAVRASCLSSPLHTA